MNIRCRESVCRNLFGPVDHDQLQQDLQLKLKEMMSQDSQRWNYNFQSEKPQLGRFQWEEIPAGHAASFYQESPQPVVEVNSPRTEDDGTESNIDEHLGTNQENYLSVSNTLKRPGETMPTRRKRSLSKPVAKSNDARITDYFATRRRSVKAKIMVSLFHTNFNKETQCQTIR
ncbi:cyclin-dependent kinase inhibitor 1-like [Poeciliopsis prolifica]|uniref:cyclin-dependent kinase inhibitor 1-like n=1 Tax=Poeciliopsis prolifica TaxID=188132 RepID=UPI0024132E1D|nr:cyclin-dependent kinase inhibitor 1-like [Poeciliopsis prolifica]